MKLDTERNEWVLEDEDIVALEPLKTLSLPPEAINSIRTLAVNLSGKNVGLNSGVLKRKSEEDYIKAFGVQKKDGEPHHELFRRGLDEYTNKLKTQTADPASNEELKAAKKEVEELKAAIAKGSTDLVTKKELEAAQQRLNDAENQLKEKTQLIKQAEENAQKAIQEKDGQIMSYWAKAEMERALNDKKFKSFIPKSALASALTVAQQQLQQQAKIEYATDVNGKVLTNEDGSPKLQLRGADGNILTSKERAAEPATIAEMYLKLIDPELFETGRTATGAGTKPDPAPGQRSATGGMIADLYGAKTREEANEIILKHMQEVEGITKSNSDAFWKRFNEISKEYQTAKLP